VSDKDTKETKKESASEEEEEPSEETGPLNFEGKVLPPPRMSAKRREMLEKPEYDIDEEDKNEPMFCVDYVMEVYDNLREREKEVAIDPDYLKTVQKPENGITPRARSTLINWMMEVCVEFKVTSETLYLSVGLVDRYLSKCVVTRDILQLVGITAMFIAAKFEELDPPPVDDFVYVSADSFSAEQIINLERKMLQAIRWNLTSPFSLYFLRRYSKASGCDTIQHVMGKYILEKALLSYDMLKYPPSLQAAAAVYLARILLEMPGPSWPRTVQYYSSYVENEVLPVAAALNSLLSVTDPKLNFVVQKYRSSKLDSVASLAAAHTREVGRTIDRRLMDQLH